ncbi:hypothetical protein ASD45_04230 [Pseudolabrys sp. Root1462]|uniref:hypothetical protein n=1 Tax=Pseudolabrys sp. Root1462 TaxID=1736466 RepID=UPI000703A159|nr:hypothetical protein [Pseudolabrys sp. Root1462]KQZ00146.1 hypothetical protein ASD45_04230 [Pseudolabrys sp. Root1462]
MTNKWLLCATTAVVLIATPALAASELQQGSGSSQVSEPSQAQRDNSQDAIGKALRDRRPPASPSDQSMDDGAARDGDRSASAGQDEQSSHGARMAQRRLRAALREAGFTDVRIVDATYLIKAKDENGNPVMMSINPSAMSHHARSRAETNGVAESGGGYGTEAVDEARGGDGDYAQARSRGGHGQWGGSGQNAFERAYERGFRAGYSRGFDSAQRR